jgi:ABC-type Fe3+ transport system substrate-binding protein
MRRSFSIKAFACSTMLAYGGVTFTRVPTAVALTNGEIATYKAADRQKVLEEGAQKEGKVTLYSTSQAESLLVPMKTAFEKQYPYLTLDVWRAGPETRTRMLAEFRANVQSADATEWGEGTVESIKAGALLPFQSPVLSTFADGAKSAEGYWAASRVSYYGTAYNTNLIKAQDIPKTYNDVLDPKYRGKLVWKANSGTGATLFITGLRKTRGESGAEEFLQKLVGQNISKYSGSAVSLVDQVGRGEYPIALQIFAQDPLLVRAKGAPIGTAMMDPIISTFGTIQMVANAPHPHAAMLLIDFFLSREGQDVVQRAGYFSANPASPPLENFKQVIPSVINMKTLSVTPEIQFAEDEQSNKLLEKHFP